MPNPEPAVTDDSGFLGFPSQLVAALRNAMEVARMGRAESSTRTPYEVCLREPTFALRRYESTAAGGEKCGTRPSLILVPPLMITAEVYDIDPEGSAVCALLNRGIDPWVVDFGAPEQEEGGLERTLADHVLACSKAVDHVTRATGRNVHLAGYSQGGIFAYLAAALRRSEGVASLVTFGSPVNVHKQALPGIPDEITVPLIEALGPVLAMGFSQSSVPAWLSRNVFRLLSPTKEIQNQLEFLRSLSDREALARKEGQRRFLGGEGFVAWPGPAFGEFIEQMIMGNRLFSGGFVVEGQTVTMADIDCPVLAFLGTRDDIARPPTVRSVGDAAPRAEIFEASIAAGHMGLVIGSRATQETWPTVAEWIFWKEGKGDPPALAVPLGSKPRKRRSRPKSEADGNGNLLDSAASIGREALGLLADAATDGAEVVTSTISTLTRQMPRLARLERLRRDTRVGLALILAEQARACPDDTFFLYEGRAHSFADADRRVDAIVRGLLSLGVRPGSHVGVLMHTRPTALAVLTAINRLGAVGVLLRPEGELAREIDAAEVEHLITDPAHAGAGSAAWPGTTYVLGGINEKNRRLPANVVDMEQIDPKRIALPAWYEPSPGRSEDVSFIFFAGSGDKLRTNRITNRRWALSAFGTASAAALTSNDTVYSWSPVQHPTGLLVSVSGALAGGARLAVAQGFVARKFWEEVRRYGATVVFYSGTILRELVEAPRNPAENKHPVRLFAGSGMPRPLWQRLIERFGPVNILEFFATTEGNTILANVSGKKVGSCGRPIPGSSEVRLARWDTEANRPIFADSGYVEEARPGEPGMLLGRVERERGALVGKPLRNVFERDDAWLVSDHLFTVDEDGDHWLYDHIGDLIRTAEGTLNSTDIEDLIGELPFVRVAAAYGIEREDGKRDVPVVAIAVRKRRKFSAEAVAKRVHDRLFAASRPEFLRIVDVLPKTVGYRVLKGPLRAEGLPKEDIAAGRVWQLDPRKRSYERMKVEG